MLYDMIQRLPSREQVKILEVVDLLARRFLNRNYIRLLDKAIYGSMPLFGMNQPLLIIVCTEFFSGEIKQGKLTQNEI